MADGVVIYNPSVDSAIVVPDLRPSPVADTVGQPIMVEDRPITKELAPPEPPPSSTQGFKFWIVFVSTLLVDMLSAIDLTAVSTALPTVVEHLHGSDFVWAGGAYTIGSTAVLPLVGGLVESFGRKPILFTLIFIFVVGSILCGTAKSMRMLIGGRALQGLGSGGSMAVTDIIFADMVPLKERGKFQGIAAAVWALACAVGPPIGGALAQSGAWRWLFFLNLPLCGIASVFIYAFFHSPAPKIGLKEKFAQMDWIGNGMVITSTVLILLALTWGGQRFPWVSWQVLVPLLVGCLGLGMFLVLQWQWPKAKIVPRFFFTEKTVLSGYLGTFFHGIVSIAIIYYLPIYLQASKGASALHSGIDMFGLSFVIPTFAIFTGVSVEVFAKYRPQNYVGWVFIVVGFGLMTLLNVHSHALAYVGLQVPVGIGLGIIWISTQFPILAPLPYANNAYALAFWVFTRSFAQSWGIVAGGAILQNVLEKKLPETFLRTLPRGQQFAYSIVPMIHTLSDPLKTEVRVAFAQGTRLIWIVMAGISGAGLLSCLIMREIPMLETTEDEFTKTAEKDVQSQIGELEAA